MPYLKIDVELLSRSDLSLLDKVLYSYIVSFKKTNSPFKCHYLTLAKTFGVSRSSIKRSIKMLLQADLITKNDLSRFVPKKMPVETPKKSNLHVVPVPSWYDEYRKNAGSTEEITFTEEEKQETLEFMKDFFKE